MENFTKGKWVVVPQNNATTFKAGYLSIQIPENCFIAVGGVNAEANAKLISQAPRLYAENKKLKSILDNLQHALANYQNETGIGMMDDTQWQDNFVNEVISHITDYETY